MTTAPATARNADPLAPVNRLWLVLGALGAGLAVFSYGPAYMPLLWVLALVLGRVSDTARHSTVAITTVAAALGALPLYLEGEIFAAAGQLLLLALAGLVLNFALDMTENRNPRGLLLAAAAWVVLPSAPGVVGLILLALYLGHERQATPYRLERAALPLTVGAALLAGLLALTLPSASTPRLSVDPVVSLENDLRTTPEVTTPDPILDPQASTSATRQRLAESLERESEETRRLLAQVMRWVGFGLTGALILLGIFLVRFYFLARAGRMQFRFHWSDPMVVAALVLVLLSLIWAALALGSEEANTSLRAVFTPSEAPLPAGPGAAPASAEPGGGGGEAITRAVLWLQPFLWAAVLGLLGLLAFARFRGLPDEQAGVAGVAATAAPPAPPAERVRRAYLAVMAAASAPGLGRTANETPQEWAARISGEHPALTGDLAPLTDTYEGVRYGRLPDAAAAADAEAHAERLQARLSELAPAPQVEGDERA